MSCAQIRENISLAKAAGAGAHFDAISADFISDVRRKMGVPAKAEASVEAEFEDLRRDFDKLRALFLGEVGKILSTELSDCTSMREFLQSGGVHEYIGNCQVVEQGLEALARHWLPQLRELVCPPGVSQHSSASLRAGKNGKAVGQP